VVSEVIVDRKGRLVLPKKIREEARITANTRLIVRAQGRGRIELFDPDLLMQRAQDIGARKLAGWREEDHEASKLLKKLVRGRLNAAP